MSGDNSDVHPLETSSEEDATEESNISDEEQDELSNLENITHPLCTDEAESLLNDASDLDIDPLSEDTTREETTRSVSMSTKTSSKVSRRHEYSERTTEPWPKDVKLFQPYEVEQILLPDNANCLAVQAFFKMCNLDFQVDPRANAEAMSPTGKVPFIKAGAFVVSEMEGIVQFVNNKGISLTDKLDPEMKSDLRAYMSLIHNVLEVAELHICWCDKETYSEITSVRHGSIYPWPLNHIQNRAKKSAVIKRLKVLGWYTKSVTEVFEEVESCCQALTDRLDEKDYFFGDKPTELDALVFGHLFTILTTPLPNNHIANTVRNYPDLINLVQRIEKDYFKRETLNE